MDKIIKSIDGISFALKSEFDFSWLNEFGRVFAVFDEQDSGNICFGLDDGESKYFLKYAGGPTINYHGNTDDTIIRMKKSMSIYEDLEHPNLIKLIKHYSHREGYLSIYEWAEGDSLHAHWNFEKYPKYTHPDSPNYKFNRLELKHKLQCLDNIFDLHKFIAGKGYVAIDFYDGSIMYDFNTNKTTICDIEFYHKGPLINTMGRMWGSSRYMSPEEFEMGASIDEVTTVFTMGATAFELLGSNSQRDIESWKASKELFKVAKKATSEDRNQRYNSMSEFYREWKKASSL